MSKQEMHLRQPAPQKSSLKVHSQSVKTQAQLKIAKPDKNVSVPKYVCFANERQVVE